ncbi:MAG: ahpF [Bacteroidetes bacterium]|jgi:thioredoxin reductase|nr:ahpF [Bacteroidota bacterium]
MESKNYEVIIIGGSFAGLSAALALGRAKRNILVIDNNNSCNKQAPKAHNFLTWDNSQPHEVLSEGKKDVMNYPTVEFKNGTASDAKKNSGGFEVILETGERFNTKKLLFATGVSDLMPEIKGLQSCWGISVLHCPYCHGYEVKEKKTAVFADGINALDICMVLKQWTNEIVLLTNGKSILKKRHEERLRSHDIEIIEKEISGLEQKEGNITKVFFKDNSQLEIPVMYAKLEFKQHCDIPEKLGCKMTKHGFIKIDESKKTTVHGIYAAGDNTSKGRTISLAVAAGTVAGMMINGELSSESF